MEADRDTNNVSKRITGLSPEKRALLEMMLKKEGITLSQPSIIPRKRTTNTFPLSFSQQRLWLLDQIEPGTAAYNMPLIVHIPGSLSGGILSESLSEIVRRHEVLRTSYKEIEGQPVQVIADPSPVNVPLICLTELPEPLAKAEARRIASLEAATPFDLRQPPMLRAMLLKLKPQLHDLLLTMHHIASDGWSMEVLTKEMWALYEAFAQGLPSPLRELPIQYVDFVMWQRDKLQGEALAAEIDYWKRQLDSAPAVLGLPTDRPRPAVASMRGSSVGVMFKPEVSEKLRRLSRQQGTSLFMSLLAGFQILLHRMSGVTDILVGTPVAGRDRIETEQLIGFFVNTLVIRNKVEGKKKYREYLGEVREVVLEGVSHQDLPFEKLVEELQPDRSLSHAPLIQVMFAMRTAAPEAQQYDSAGESFINPVASGNTSAKFDFSLTLNELNGIIQGEIEYSTDLFDEETIHRISGHFQTLIEDIIEDPDRQIRDLALLTPEQHRQIVEEWNDTEAEYAKESCIHELFEAHLNCMPNAVAAVHGADSLTYSELNRRANQLANYLRRIGVGVESPVAICVEPSLDLLIGLLGIFKAGAAYVPLDSDYPAERLAYMLDDSGAKVLVKHSGLMEGIAGEGVAAVCLDTDRALIAGESEQRPLLVVEPDNLAYLIYTSGSTGMPKAVCGTHRGVINLLADFDRKHPLGEESRCSLWTSLSFDASVYEIFSAWSAGAALHIAPREIRPEARRFIEWMRESRINSAYVPPFMLSELRDYLEACDGFTSLRRLLVGVEPINELLLASIVKAVPGLRVINGYGPTESTVCTSVYPVESHSASDRRTPIGGPVQNSKIYLLDQDMSPVPVGVPGEMYIAGDGLARGYANRPDLTAERFVPSPFGSDEGARLYSTGDLGRYLPDGDIEFIGRKDNQLKIRGFRIEPGEIEATLIKHPAVQEVAVISQQDGHGQKRLVAYVEGTDGEATPAELRRFLKSRLPDHLIPSAFVNMKVLPKTPNGKMDRKRLPALTEISDGSRNGFVPPRDSLELKLVKTWERVLQLEPIGVRDNFFEIGGHSLLAVRLMNEMRPLFDADYTVGTLFRQSTVEDLANFIRRPHQPVNYSPLIPIQEKGSAQPFFCVHPAGGGVFCYAELAREIGGHQPFYGLQARGLDEGQEPCANLEEMASRYLEAVRLVQPEGPYYLGGWSIGGLIAYEMARQLNQQGQEIGLVAMIDTWAPAAADHADERGEQDLLISFALDLGLSADDLSGLISLAEAEEERQFSSVLELAIKVGAVPPGVGPEHLKRLYGVYKSNARALRTHAHEGRGGDIRATLFEASEKLKKARVTPEAGAVEEGPSAGWRAWSSGALEVREVPGNHFTVVRQPNVKALADELRECLLRAQAE